MSELETVHPQCHGNPYYSPVSVLGGIQCERQNPPWCVLYVILSGFTVFLGSSGGICEKSKLYSDGKKKSLNTGIITVQNYASHVPPKVSHITFAHEVGHNFGSPVSILSWALSGCSLVFYRSSQL